MDIVSLENGEFSLFLFCKWLESSQTALFIAFFYSQMFCVWWITLKLGWRIVEQTVKAFISFYLHESVVHQVPINIWIGLVLGILFSWRANDPCWTHDFGLYTSVCGQCSIADNNINKQQKFYSLVPKRYDVSSMLKFRIIDNRFYPAFADLLEDGLSSNSNEMVLKCDLHEALIDPLTLLNGEYFVSNNIN